MDSYSISKRNADPILKLGMDRGISAKLQTMQDRQKDILRQQQSVAKDLHQKLGEHILSQSSNQRALEKHMVSSKLSFSGLNSRHSHPNMEHHRQVAQTVQGLEQGTSEIGAVQLESEKYQKRLHTNQQENLEAQAGSLSAWFARYGEPKRQPSQFDLHRSYVLKPRWNPTMQAFSNATAVRQGHITK
mmetsp:Transcript_24322/g.52915  ORF Transcript_24322/g.52915 Transcript_24322/m.52915 type:complete len:188 (+) Transcript_24322:263-826(+)